MKSGWITTTNHAVAFLWCFGLGFSRRTPGQWPNFCRWDTMGPFGACWQKVEFRIPLSSRPKHTKTLETDILRQEWWWRQRRHTRYLGWQVRGRGLNTELQSKQKVFDVSDVSSSSVGLDITWSDEIVMNPWKGWYFIMNIAAPRSTCYRFLLWICLRRRGSLDFASQKKNGSCVSRMVVQWYDFPMIVFPMIFHVFKSFGVTMLLYDTKKLTFPQGEQV